jgi:hypothetical protein
MTGILALAGWMIAADAQARSGMTVQAQPENQFWSWPTTPELKLPSAPPATLIYKAVPFSGLVLVPGETGDEEIAHTPHESVQHSLRIVSPEMDLIPLRTQRQ